MSKERGTEKQVRVWQTHGGLMHGAMRPDGRHWEGEGCDPQHCPLFISHGEGHMAYRGYRVGKRTQKGQIGGAGVRDTS